MKSRISQEKAHNSPSFILVFAKFSLSISVPWKTVKGTLNKELVEEIEKETIHLLLIRLFEGID